jgi:RimJ/RimL family protein N-acetyltransferase
MSCPAQVEREQMEYFIATDVGEELLATAYLLLQKDNLLGVVFYERVPQLSEFLSWLKRGDSFYFAAFARHVQSGTCELAGIGWLWNVSPYEIGRRADAGIVFLRKFWGGGVPEEITGQMLDWAFTTGRIETIYMVTSASNRLLQRFTRALGFTHYGPLPNWGLYQGKPGSAVMGVLEKKKWTRSL